MMYVPVVAATRLEGDVHRRHNSCLSLAQVSWRNRSKVAVTDEVLGIARVGDTLRPAAAQGVTLVVKPGTEFINQFLSMDFVGNHDPDVYGPQGINGVDYHYKMFQMHPAWVKHAHDRGMSVNAWTVNKEDDIRKMIELGVDAITTNEPLLVRRLLGDKEYK